MNADQFCTDQAGEGIMILYVYAVGSNFETILNEYMIDPSPFMPPGSWPSLDMNISSDPGVINRTVALLPIGGTEVSTSK